MTRPAATGAVPSARRDSFIALAIIATACVALGFYAVQLNARFYQRSQPFYDSMSYHEDVHDVMTTTREKGLLPAMHQSCQSSTVCLPLLIASVLGLVFEPSRAVGIWIQVGELLVLACTLFYYLQRVRGLSAPLALVGTAPLLSLQCLFSFNGGLSDFRMDLSLFLLYATAALCYLIARETGRLLHYALLGLACTAACLFRATAPVYLVVALGPIALADLCFQPHRAKAALGLAVATATAAAGCLWFFLLNFDYLHYYYVVWNTDANAHLPLHESIQHLIFVAKHLGRPTIQFVLFFQFVVILDAAMAHPPRSWPAWFRGFRPTHVDWRMLWIGLAPVLFLVWRGAGLNPFVSMPAVFGLTCFMLFPLVQGPRRFSRWALAAICAAAVMCSAAAWRSGWKSHRGDEIDSMAAHQSVLRAIADDAAATGQSRVAYSTLHCHFLHPKSLHNVAMFDMPEASIRGKRAVVRGVQLAPRPQFAVAAEATWRKLPGGSDEEKLRYLVDKAAAEVQYLVLLDEPSAQFMQERIPWNVVNRHAVGLRQQVLASGTWTPVSGEIRNGSDEAVRVYRNDSARLAQRP